MSLYGALRVGVSGLFVQSQAVATASDNISNVNTDGFKVTRARFSTLVTTQSGLSSFSPGGVQSVIRREVSEQGLIQSTTTSTDIAITGNGFFTVTDRLERNLDTGAYDIAGNVFFTRAGEFRPDQSGNLINPQGYYLVGWPSNENNTDFDRTNVHSSFKGVNVNNQTTVPVPSSDVFFSANLNAQAANATNFDITTQVFDRQGSQRNLQVLFTKEDANLWSVSAQIIAENNFEGGIIADRRGDAAGGGAPSTGIIDNGVDRLVGNTNLTDLDIGTVPSERAPATIAYVTFSDRGTLESVVPIDGEAFAAGPDGRAQYILDSDVVPAVGADRDEQGFHTSYALDATAATNNGVRFFVSYDGSINDGVTDQEIGFNQTAADDNVAVDLRFGTIGATDGLTQFDGANSINFFTQNGRQFGTLTGVNFSTDGTVTAQFDNGDTRPVYQVPVTTFANPNGLSALTGNVFNESELSGSAIAHIAGTGGGGSLAPSSLEASTVDLAEEFTELIIAQRNFSANTRSITTADQLLEELVRLVR